MTKKQLNAFVKKYELSFTVSPEVDIILDLGQTIKYLGKIVYLKKFESVFGVMYADKAIKDIHNSFTISNHNLILLMFNSKIKEYK